MNKKANKLKGKIISSKKGLLIIYQNKLNNFKLQRFFIISSEKSKVRGEHGHKKCNQIFVSLNDNVLIEVYNKSKKIFKLKKYDSVFIPCNNWVKIKFANKKSSIVVLCDQKFRKSDYFYKKLI